MADIDTLTGEALEQEARAVYTRYAEANPALASEMSGITASNIEFLQNGKLGPEDLQIIRKYAKETNLPVLEKIQVALENTAPSITNMVDVLEEAAPVVAKKERGIARWFIKLKAKVSGLFSRETKPVEAPVVSAKEDHSRFMPQPEAVSEEVTAEAAVAEAGAHLPSFTPPSDVMREVTTENGITFEKVVEGQKPFVVPSEHEAYLPNAAGAAAELSNEQRRIQEIAEEYNTYHPHAPVNAKALDEAGAKLLLAPGAVTQGEHDLVKAFASEQGWHSTVHEAEEAIAKLAPAAEEVVEEVSSAAKKKSGGIIGWVKEKWHKLWAKDERLLEAEQKAKEANKLGRNAKKEAGTAEKVLSEASHMGSGKKWAIGLTVAAAAGAWAAYAHEGKKMREAEQRAGRR